MNQMFPMGDHPDGYYKAGRFRLVPAIFTCFWCRQEPARELDPEEVVYVFRLEPWGAGYVHVRCLPEDFKATVDARVSARVEEKVTEVLGHGTTEP